MGNSNSVKYPYKYRDNGTLIRYKSDGIIKPYNSCYVDRNCTDGFRCCPTQIGTKQIYMRCVPGSTNILTGTVSTTQFTDA